MGFLVFCRIYPDRGASDSQTSFNQTTGPCHRMQLRFLVFLMSSASAFNLSYCFDRFNMAASQIFGKRLTWNEVNGKNHEPPTYLN